LYLTASRLDIMLAVGLVARYQAAPKKKPSSGSQKNI